MSQRSSHRPYRQGSTFMYIFLFISIDLQLSRSFNSPTLHCYSYKPGSHYLLSNQSTYCTVNLLPHLRSHYFYHLCSVSSFFTYQTNGRSTSVDERTRPTTNGRIKSKVRNVKIRFAPRRQL